jgi:cation diffusion facilitator family transporter
MVIMVCCEVLAFACSLAAAWRADSLTLWANCLRIGLDLPASFFALYVTHRILRRQDGNFNYGLGKWENLASLINVPVMFVALVFLGVRAIQSFQNPHPITNTGFGLVVLLVFAGFNIYLLRRFYNLHRVAPSPLIHAQLVLYRNAAVASAMSIVALLGTRLGGTTGTYFDILGAAVLSVMIIQSAVLLLRQSLSALLDEAVEESLQQRIMNGLAGASLEYQSLRRVRSRHAGDRVFIELFLEFDPAISVGEMLRRSEKIQKQIGQAVPGAEVVIVPCGSTPPAQLRNE